MNQKLSPELLALIFGGLIVLFAAFPLDRFSGSILGHLFGIVGAAFIIAALIYPYKKRIRGLKGKSNPLHPHVYLGLTGAILVTLHAAGRSSIIGMLVYLTMFLVVMSGVVGRILFVKVNRSLKNQKEDAQALRASFQTLKTKIDPRICSKAFRFDTAVATSYEDDVDEIEAEADPNEIARCREFRILAESIAEKEEVIQVYDRTKSLFRFWNAVHVNLSLVFFSLLIVHVFATIYYGLRWLQ
jgi:hypothetical protein